MAVLSWWVTWWVWKTNGITWWCVEELWQQVNSGWGWWCMNEGELKHRKTLFYCWNVNVKGCVVPSACIYSVRYNSVMAYSSSVRNGGVWDLHRCCILERHCFTVVILLGVTLNIFQHFGLQQEGFFGVGSWCWIVSMKKESEHKMHVHVVDKVMVTKKQQQNYRDIWEWQDDGKVNDLTEGLVHW